MSSALQHIVNAVPVAGDGEAASLNELPNSVVQAIWRGNEIGSPGTSAIATGFDELNANLPGGGWPFNSLTEVLQSQPSLCEWRLLSPALASLVAGGGQLLLVGPPKRPHVPGLMKLGITDRSLVCITADTPAERLWTTEQLVKANPRGGAILAWLPQARSEQIRRLQVHAQSCDCPVFLFRPEAVQQEASPAPLRVLASLGQDWTLQVKILKRKGSAIDQPVSVLSVPGTLSNYFTPRLMRPSQSLGMSENSNVVALGSTATRRRARQLATH